MSNDGSSVTESRCTRSRNCGSAEASRWAAQELAIQQRAEVRQRTARVYERDGQRRVRAIPTGAARFHPGRRGARPAPAGPEATRRSPTGMRRRLGQRRVTRDIDPRQIPERVLDDERRSNQVPRRLARHHARLLHLERHRHARHEAFDVAVFDRDLLTRGIDGDDLADNFVGRLAGARDRHRASSVRDRIARTRRITCTLAGRSRAVKAVPAVGLTACILLYSAPKWEPRPLPCAGR